MYMQKCPFAREETRGARRGGGEGGGEIFFCSCASLALLSLTKMRSALSLGGVGGGVQIITGSLINCLLRKTFRLEK